MNPRAANFSAKRSGSMLVLGLMSGTSADGIDVALARIAGAPPNLRARLLHSCTLPFATPVRKNILRLAEGGASTAAEICRLNFLLGQLFADAALAACRRFHVSPRRISLIGSHGQTIYHQGAQQKWLTAHRLACTMQVGEPSVIAQRTGIHTVGDFRPADIAAGGQGAPLVPFVDYLLYRHARLGRVALNIGGIANVTVVPAAAKAQDVFAFDTGPGNMILDGLAQELTSGRIAFDRNARLARQGMLLPALLAELLRDPFFQKKPPKSCGREQYGREFVQAVLSWGKSNHARPEDLLYTATVFTSLTIVEALRRFVARRIPIRQVIVSGGGAHNPLLMDHLKKGLLELDAGRGTMHRVELLRSMDLGISEDAKEAFAFAILAYESWHGRPANLPSATGASRPVVLGKICLAN